MLLNLHCIQLNLVSSDIDTLLRKIKSKLVCCHTTFSTFRVPFLFGEHGNYSLWVKNLSESSTVSCSMLTLTDPINTYIREFYPQQHIHEFVWHWASMFSVLYSSLSKYQLHLKNVPLSPHSDPGSFSYLYWTGLGVCHWKNSITVK